MQLDPTVVREAIARLSPEEANTLIEAMREHQARLAHPFHRLYPDVDTQYDDQIVYAREKYPRHLEFFKASADYREICMMAANRTGKTLSGAFSTSSHLTGLYRDWWPGRRFDCPIRAWACGKSNATTRDIVQYTLLGEVKWDGMRKRVTGEGMIPAHLIGDITWKQGTADTVDTVKIQYVSDGWSTLGFKSYEAGRGAFEGTSQHVIWLDEEPPADIYGEALIRTATVNGIVLLTFTPLEGYSDTAKSFMPVED